MLDDEAKRRFEKWFRVREDGCWAWTGGLSTAGYGQFRAEGKNRAAHKIAYRIYKGEIPAGLWVLHKCHNTECVNPEHLYASTAVRNSRDRDEAGHGPQGAQNGNAKLSASARELVQSSNERIAFYLGKLCGISISQVYRLRRKKRIEAKLALRKELSV